MSCDQDEAGGLAIEIGEGVGTGSRPVKQVLLDRRDDRHLLQYLAKRIARPSPI